MNLNIARRRHCGNAIKTKRPTPPEFGSHAEAKLVEGLEAPYTTDPNDWSRPFNMPAWLALHGFTRPPVASADTLEALQRLYRAVDNDPNRH